MFFKSEVKDLVLMPLTGPQLGSPYSEELVSAQCSVAGISRRFLKDYRELLDKADVARDDPRLGE
jgi:hypothetical protein